MRSTRPAATVVVSTLLVLMVVLVVLRAGQRRLTYFPAGPPPPVSQVLPGGRDVTLTTADGLDLRGWWLPGGPTAALVMPGNGGNRAGRAPLAAALHDLGLSVLLLDYRGYGGNPGAPSEPGLLADGRAAADWLAGRDDVEDLVLFGESLGGAIAVAVAPEVRPDALVLRSPFTSLVDIARAHYGPVPAWLLQDRYPSLDRIGQVTAPLLVVASEDDEVVPYAQSLRLFEAASEPKRLVTLADAGHNDRALLDGEVLVDAVRQFLADHDLLPDES